MEQNLRDRGYEVHTAAVGPISSNWDRAAELFAYIKGGQVDYGESHAAKFGHERFGAVFPGLYPDWGTRGKNGRLRKIHLLAHSQGGQTAKVLVHLLNQGAPDGLAESGGDVSPLFGGGKDWVASVTTLSTPHDGTPLSTSLTEFLPRTRAMAFGFLALAGLSPREPVLYDFKLDHFGLHRQTYESFDDYLEGVRRSGIWGHNKDIASYDLSPEGARELNMLFHAQPNVYYFTWSGRATFRGFFTGQHYPNRTMLPFLRPFARIMGKYARDGEGSNSVHVDSTWWPNDGVVPTRSMAGPSTDKVVEYEGSLQKGVWMHMGVKENWDHADIIGIGTTNGEDFLYERVAQLWRLPE